MRRSILALVLAAAPAGAFAQPVPGGVGQRLDIVGDAPGACIMRGLEVVSAANATVRAAGERAAVIDFAQLVDPETSVARAASINLSLPVICNGAHSLSLRTERGALVQEEGAPAGAGFQNRLVYQYAADWAGQRLAGASDAALRISTSNAAAGEVLVSVNVPEGGEPLVSGTYADSIVIELQPAS